MVRLADADYSRAAYLVSGPAWPSAVGPGFGRRGSRVRSSLRPVREVTIFDNSPKQLEQDRRVSDAHDLGIPYRPGDMRNLSVFEPDSFDLIFNPCSILFVDTLQPVWEECFRVATGGILMTGLLNPLAYQIDEEDLKLKYAEPYSDLHSLP